MGLNMPHLGKSVIFMIQALPCGGGGGGRGGT